VSLSESKCNIEELAEMVFLTSALCARVAKHTNEFFGRAQHGPDRFWKRRKLYMMTSHLYGRARNCFYVATRYNIRQLQHTRKMREARKLDTRDLWDARVEGQAKELNYNTWNMREALSRTGIQLDRHSISALALTEPRTFRALTAVAALKTQQSPEEGGLGRGIADGTGPNIPVVGKL